LNGPNSGIHAFQSTFLTRTPGEVGRQVAVIAFGFLASAKARSTRLKIDAALGRSAIIISLAVDCFASYAGDQNEDRQKSKDDNELHGGLQNEQIF